MIRTVRDISHIEKNARIVLYGAGGMGARVMDEIMAERPDLDIRYFADTYKEGELKGKKIILGSLLAELESEYDLILVTSHLKKEIERDLENQGLESKILDVAAFNEGPLVPGKTNWGDKLTALSNNCFFRGDHKGAQDLIDQARVRALSRDASLLTSAIFLITLKCNLHCSHCWGNPYFRQYMLPFSEMALGKVIKVLEGIQRVNPHLPLLLSGGEACIRQDVDHILGAASEMGMHIVLLTNGTLPGRVAELLEKPGIADSIVGVAVSIDGTQEVHNRIRGKGSFEKTLETISIFNSHGKAVSIGSVIQRGNQDQLGGLIRVRKKLMDEFDVIVAPMNVEIASGGGYIPVDFKKVKSSLSRESRYLVENEKSITGLGCRAGITKCTILPSGHVLACGISGAINKEPYLLGILSDYDHDFEKLWHSAKAENIRDSIKDCPGCASFCER